MKALKFLFIIIAIAAVQFINAQTRYYFNVSFSNKSNSTYSLSAPEAFLSAAALQRRTAFNVAIDSTDLPVNQTYVSQVVALGTVVNNRSKWLNSITVHMTDSTIAQQIRTLPFVKKAEYTGLRASGTPVKQNAKLQQESTIDYGTANNQIEQMKGKFIHQMGYTGAGVVVAVLDAGFRNVNTNPGFDSLRLQGRLLGTKDFAVPGSNVYNEDAHGANVLSIMTGRLAGNTPFAGTAPHASYWLIRTEYAATEYMNEVDFWVSGIEFADSVGAKVVNSPMGYTTVLSTKQTAFAQICYANNAIRIVLANKPTTYATLQHIGIDGKMLLQQQLQQNETEVSTATSSLAFILCAYKAKQAMSK